MTIGVRDAFTNGQQSGSINQESPPSLSKFLTDNIQDTNQNRKFPTSSPTASVLGRLGYDFTPSDPTTLELSSSAKKHLQSMPRMLKDWQAEDLRNGNVGGYLKNPVADVVNSINGILQQIQAAIFVQSTTYATPLEEVYNQATFALEEGTKFLSHTNRVSGVTKPTADTADYPHLNQVLGIGRTLLYICNQVDGITNNSPVLGSMTSILIEDELVTNKNNIVDYPELIANSITTFVDNSENGFSISASSNLSASQIQEITTNLRNIKVLFSKRRTHDENFWTKSRQIVDEFQTLDQLNSGGEVQNFLFNNYVGTDKLKEGLSTPDNPPEFEKQIIVSDMGHYTVYNKTTGEIVESDQDLVDQLLNAELADDLIKTVFDQGTPPKPNTTTAQTSTSQIATLDQYIENYNANVLSVTVGTNTLNVNTGAIIFRTFNGVWSGTRIIQVTNVNDNVYYYSNAETVSNFLNSEVEVEVQDSTKRRSIASVTVANTGTGYSNGLIVITGGGTDNIPATIIANVNSISGAIVTLNIQSAGAYTSVPTLSASSLGGSDANLIAVLSVPTNSIANGESFNVSVQFRSLTSGNTVDYGLITIDPGIGIRVKGYSNVSTEGILLPGSITQNVGNATNRLLINEFNGPYEILDAEATGLEKWTFRNLSANSLNIVSVIETTNSLSTNGNTHMNVQLYQASTPNVLNVNDSVLWYANVKPLIEFPNVSTFLITTEQGQQRTITIGIDRGNVDDSNLYNEVVNSNPDIIVTSALFDIRVFGGKANTRYTYSGPNISGSGTIGSNGYAKIANTSITNIGSYTYVVDFEGTSHRRTLTKVITT